MALDSTEAKQLLQRLIFHDDQAQDWVQDVWDMSPTLGETASRLWEVMETIVDGTDATALEALLQQFYQGQIDRDL